jgi:hypothetical protein
LKKNIENVFSNSWLQHAKKEEQAKQDIEGIATVFRNAMFGMALLIIGFFAAKCFKIQ